MLPDQESVELIMWAQPSDTPLAGRYTEGNKHTHTHTQPLFTKLTMPGESTLKTANTHGFTRQPVKFQRHLSGPQQHPDLAFDIK